MVDIAATAEFIALASRVTASELALVRQVADEAKYPTMVSAQPSVDVEVLSRAFDPARGYADVEVRLTAPCPTTVHAVLATKNGDGATGAYAGNEGTTTGMYVKATYYCRFMPGETRKFVRLVMGSTAFPAGYTAKVEVGDVSGFARRSAASFVAVLTAQAGAPEPLALPATLPVRPWAFDNAAADFTLAGSGIDAMLVADSHEGGKWMTAAHESRSQPGNKETGFYSYAADGYIVRSGGVLTLRSGTLASPRTDEGKSYPHAASMVTGINIPETQTVYGAYEVEAMMPSIAGGCWPAFWLMQVKGGPAAADLRTQWPGEIDIHEGFGYEAWHRPDTGLAAHIHQGYPGARLYDAGCKLMPQALSGVAGLTTGYHRYGVEITVTTLYFYIDGIEFWRCANPFVNGAKWFPLLNVAVKCIAANTDWTPDTYAGGAQFAAGGEMKVRALRVWRRSA